MMFVVCFAALAVATAAEHDASLSKPVSVQLFGEAGCPDTTGFIFGPLAAAEKAAGVAEVMRLEWIPFGNAYFISEECGGVPAPHGCRDSSSCLYNGTVRDCYFEHCGRGARHPFAGCYKAGQVRCQHGPTECAANRVQACAKLHSPATYWDSSKCIEHAFYTGVLNNGDPEEKVLQKAESCGVGKDLLASCFSTAAGDTAVEDMAKATPSHPGVPYVLVNGEPLQDMSKLLTAVCKAFQGPLPEGCTSSALLV
eukprot:TRINITY_DN29203_c0_g1_i1.p1 TRINITY_DN29203_c0_g1~~TRINITY_DN29203_c0_g1_i1.p1  ORF type:complete len:271 (+),score=44.85 TRINITY_DN29203_c0_g1_i1:52-813(+)